MRCLVIVLAALVIVAGAGPSWGKSPVVRIGEAGRMLERTPGGSRAAGTSRADTLWIFDADFEDLAGDNAGWETWDLSGTRPCTNYWAVDTIRTPLSRPYLGDHTWWCGTYAVNNCWKQERGYGNDWTCILERDFPEVDAITPGWALKLEWDQRYAMENSCDYGYVEVSTDEGGSWTTLAMYDNSGFPPHPGTPMDWGGTSGHPVISMNTYAGQPNVRLRFRFVSSWSYSSEDQYDNPTYHSYMDGAWQIDNIQWSKRRPATELWIPFWLDDCETGGDPNWVHDDFAGADQAGVTFARYQYPYDISEGRDPVCGPPDGSWVMAAVDPVTLKAVDGEDAFLASPVMNVSNPEGIVVRWTSWLDAVMIDKAKFWYATSDSAGCVSDPDYFWWLVGAQWWGGPAWSTRTTQLDADAMSVVGDLFRVGWEFKNVYAGAHMGGLFLDRVRIGITTGVAEGTPVKLFNDYFDTHMKEAADDSAIVYFGGTAAISSVRLVVVGLGTTFPAQEMSPGSREYGAPMPPEIIAPGRESFYYFEAFDSALNSFTCPPNAPDECFECSILPRLGNVLIVDKAGQPAPGEDGQYEFETSYYYESALEILGYTWDRFDVPAMNGGLVTAVHGPTWVDLQNYDTVFWVTGSRTENLLTSSDRGTLPRWLESEPMGDGRNLMLAGNNWGQYADGSPEHEWLEDYAGVDDVQMQTDEDQLLLLDEGIWTFPTGALITGCPELARFSSIWEDPAAVIEASYETPNMLHHPAAVLWAHPTYGYQVTTLGFGVEYVAGEGGGEGTASRIGIIQAALESMSVEPSAPGTGVPDPVVRDGISYARPNPFNPTTTIDYGIATGGPVSVRLYDLSGKLVRTLLDSEVPAGTAGQLVWDGTDDRGAACASGVYFCKVDAPGFDATRKLVLLK